MSTPFLALRARAEILLEGIAPGRCVWNHARRELAITGKGPLGIDLAITHDAEDQVVYLETNRGYHDHFHVDQFDSETAVVDAVF